MKKRTAIDLFSGAGGLTQGLKQAGFNVVGAVESVATYADSYRMNHPKTNLKESDITKIDPVDYMKELGLKVGELDLLAGCPPCQGYSTIGTRNRGKKNDPRNELVYEVLRFAIAFQPKTIMMENVPALNNDERLKRLVDELKKLGVNIEEWRSHLPKNIDDSLSPILASLSSNLEFPEKQQEAAKSIEELHKLIPEYPYLHWRHLHQTLKDAVFDYYKAQDYYTAVFEGVKKYINEVKAKSASILTDRDLLENVYQLANPVLSVTAGFTKPDGNNFEADTTENITQGHRMLAIAIWQAFRSPIAHEVAADLRDSKLYTEQDCLDALGLLSHLFNRLEKATKIR